MAASSKLTRRGLDIKLTGITNGCNDISTDTFRAVSLDIFKCCGAAVDMKVKQRAVGPDGKGCVVLSVPNVTHIDRPIVLTDEGLVKRVRGVAWTCRMPPAFSHQLLSSAKGVLLKLLADVTIFSDVVSTPNMSQGYGVTLIAETSSGRFISTERCISGAELLRCREEQIVPDDIGQQAACALLDEVKRGGVVDGTHQGLLLMMAALGPPEVNTVRLGALTGHAVKTLRHLKDFLGITFDMKTDAASSTVFLSCVGYGLKNMARKVQ